jgi:hypothetical protein
VRTSDTLKAISPDLVAAALELHNIARDAKGNYGGYTSLAGLIDGSKGILASHGITVISDVTGEDGITIITRLQHKSGEYIESCGLNLPLEKRTAQGAGSAITYGRRYSLAAMLNISSKDEDDDGEVASKVEAKKPKAEPKAAPKPNGFTTPDQHKKIRVLMKEIGWSADDMHALAKDKWKVDSSKDLTVSQAHDLIEILLDESAALKNAKLGDEVTF